MKRKTGLKISLATASAFLLLLAGLSPIAKEVTKVKAETSLKTVKIGCYEEPGMMNFENGKIVSGYAYEYMLGIANQAGWKIEYITGTFTDLLNELELGNIHAVPYVSDSDLRRSQFLFPKHSMANERFYLASTTDMDLTDLSVLNGKKIGSVTGYFQNELFEKYIEGQPITCEVCEYADVNAKWEALKKGEVDITIESSLVMQPIDLKPLIELEFEERRGEPFHVYTAFSKKFPQLCNELDEAAKEIEKVTPSFLSNLYSKYFQTIPLFKSLSKGALNWLENHDSIKIGVFNNDNPLIILNDDGSVTGIMPEYIDKMFKNYGIDIKYDWKFFNSNQEALVALKNGEIDTIHPYYSSYVIAEDEGVIISNSAYESGMTIMYLDNFKSSTLDKIATPYTRLGAHYVKENYPNSTIVPCLNGYDCINKVLSGEATAAILNTNALRKIASEYNDERIHLKSLTSLCKCCFAAMPENYYIIEIINHVIPFLSDTELNVIEAKYFVEEDVTPSFGEFLQKNPWVLPVAVFLITGVASGFIILALVRRNDRLKRAAAEEAQNSAEFANKSKTEFLFNMSHDIRTPMNAILGYTDRAIRHSKREEIVNDSLYKIKMSSKHLLDLINDILEMSRIESGKLELSREPIDMREAIYTVQQMSETLASKKDISFKTNIVDLKNPYVFADQLHFDEVLINIISNAIKYTNDHGKVEYTVAQLTNIIDGKARYRFIIEDNGIGMSKEFLEHVFENFAREKNSTVSREEGAGLGLPIVKKIIDLAGGSINIESELGKGTKVTVEFDIEVMSKDEIDKLDASKQINKAKFEQRPLAGRSILLVEDNVMNQEIAKDILEELGAEVYTAEDGTSAVAAMKNGGVDDFDAILMDIQMPKMDGYEATKLIRQLPGGNDVPIIAVSANAFVEDKKKSLEAGMNDHIAKPVEVRALLEVLERYF